MEISAGTTNPFAILQRNDVRVHGAIIGGLIGKTTKSGS